ncbi:transcription factor RF2b [Olea europaea subsp. europaea]|uniref:Transcription factor RF2b n=1 Tax=Olea europaea subsp. europaea TaxID=158383 RepID=A0A8S0RHJ1_OLEEU|nr:transcription factor RF2b [Olea europaea subsp. europaea]
MQDPNSKHFSGPMRPAHHRRAHSEMNFRLPEDLDLGSDTFDPRAGSFEEMGSEDDLFSTYMDIEKLSAGGGSGMGENVFDNAGGFSGGIATEGGGDGEKSSGNGGIARHRHRHSNSMDSSLFSGESSIEAKKAMAPDKLAELWNLDPKRAKRILANRQSAARSKERKAHYMSELERKVQTLQTEATTLSAQLTLFQRTCSYVIVHQMEMVLQIQIFELHPYSNAYDLAAMQHIQYNQSAFFSHRPQSRPNDSQNVQMPQFHPLHAGMSTNPHPMHSAAHTQATSNAFQQDPLGRFQGLDISSRGSHLVKSEDPSASASESTSTF